MPSALNQLVGSCQWISATGTLSFLDMLVIFRYFSIKIKGVFLSFLSYLLPNR